MGYVEDKRKAEEQQWVNARGDMKKRTGGLQGQLTNLPKMDITTKSRSSSKSAEAEKAKNEIRSRSKGA